MGIGNMDFFFPFVGMIKMFLLNHSLFHCLKLEVDESVDIGFEMKIKLMS